jgi:sigma-B regulation protein RsbU (phosphoserine phosphatase)
MINPEAYKILIVDDNLNNVQLLGSILNSHSFKAEFATSGKEALEWTENEDFDIILLDVMMQDMDGYQVCSILKSNKKTAHIPVIFITAKYDTESIVKGFDTGASDYVAKPFNEKELMSRLKYQLELLTTKRELEKTAESLQEKNDTIMQSIRYAEKLQEAMLPTAEEIEPYFKNHFIYFRPLQNLSGDFYWSKATEKAKYFVIGDSMGHGIPGALLSMVGINALNDVFEKDLDISPADMLTQLRKKEQTVFSSKAGIMHDSIDMAVCKFCNKSLRLEFSGANLNMVIISNSEKEIDFHSKHVTRLQNEKFHLIQIPGSKNTIGKNLIVDPFTNIRIQLSKNDIVYLFSDGYRDQFGGSRGQKFKKKRFLELLLRIAHLPFKNQNEALDNSMTKWRGKHTQIDDITVIGLQPF